MRDRSTEPTTAAAGLRALLLLLLPELRQLSTFFEKISMVCLWIFVLVLSKLWSYTQSQEPEAKRFPKDGGGGGGQFEVDAQRREGTDGTKKVISKLFGTLSSRRYIFVLFLLPAAWRRARAADDDDDGDGDGW